MHWDDQNAVPTSKGERWNIFLHGCDVQEEQDAVPSQQRVIASGSVRICHGETSFYYLCIHVRDGAYDLERGARQDIAFDAAVGKE